MHSTKQLDTHFSKHQSDLLWQQCGLKKPEQLMEENQNWQLTVERSKQDFGAQSQLPIEWRYPAQHFRKQPVSAQASKHFPSIVDSCLHKCIPLSLRPVDYYSQPAYVLFLTAQPLTRILYKHCTHASPDLPFLVGVYVIQCWVHVHVFVEEISSCALVVHGCFLLSYANWT